MFGSILLTIYTVFLLVFSAVMGFAFYRVLLFCKNKEIEGHAKKISYITLGIMIFIFLSSIMIFGRYDWDDGFASWMKNFISTESRQEEQVEAKKKEEDVIVEKKGSKLGLNSVDKNDNVSFIENGYHKKVIKILGLDRFIKID